jgi:hypothetical protein
VKGWDFGGWRIECGGAEPVRDENKDKAINGERRAGVEGWQGGEASAVAEDAMCRLRLGRVWKKRE